MMKPIGRIAAVIMLLMATGSSVLAASCENPLRLRFSLVPQADAKKDSDAFKPLLAALEKELGKPVEVILPTSYGFVVEGLLASSIDLAMLGPASYASAKNSDPDVIAFATYASRAGAFQEEGPFYRSLLLVRSNSSFDSRESLRGARLALADPASTSGAVVPRYFFSELIKMPLERYFGRIVFSGSHDKSAVALLSGSVDAAFISGAVVSDLINKGSLRKEDFRVLWQSENLPLDPFVFRGKLCPNIKEKIRKVFLAANGEAYPALLERLGALRFAPISDESYKTIREILRVERQPGN